jgi:hypothetical protein
MNLPQPLTNSDFFLKAVVDKLEEIRMAVIDVESELQKLNAATQSTPIEQPKILVQLDADKIASAINVAISERLKFDGKRASKS